MKVVDPTNWSRAAAFAHYRPYAMPHMALTSRVDVTALHGRCKAEGRSFFAAMLHGACGAVNTVPELRQRLRVIEGEDVVVEHPVVDPAFTVAVADGGFDFASVPFVDDPAVFDGSVARVSDAKRTSTTRSLAAFDGRRDDVVYLSCLPWVAFTSLTHPVSSTDDTVPRIAWGRFEREGARVILGVNLQVHHALVDGAHLGAFFSELGQRCADEAQ